MISGLYEGPEREDCRHGGLLLCHLLQKTLILKSIERSYSAQVLRFADHKDIDRQRLKFGRL
jgi:hypothetical protein